MPSPFPGMDPYLEDPALWPDVHARLITTLAEKLMAALRPAYFVQVEERVYLTDWDDPGVRVYIPDVNVVATQHLPGRGNGGTAVIDEPIVITNEAPAETHESYLEVKDARSREVITVIEVLSPSNKIPGSAGRRSYLEKRDALVATKTQFVEIDLLRDGERMPWVGPLPRTEYVVQASNTAGKVRGKIWPMRLTERLKTIGIPLKPGEADAPLNLQAVLETVYARAGYDLVIDYTRPPEPPLTPEQAAWAKSLPERSVTGTKTSS